MAKYTVVDDAEGLIPEETIVRARLDSIIEEEVNYVDKQTKQPKSFVKLKWGWTVTASDWRDVEVTGECDNRLTNYEGNKFRQWAEALIGREMAVGEGIDTDDLVGLSGDVSVIHEESKKTGRVFMRVDMVMPIDPSQQDESVPF